MRPRISIAVERDEAGAIRVGGIGLTVAEARKLADSIHDAIETTQEREHD
ncbi:hypothetical protein ACPXB3_00475 [Gordonia sp. DT219]